MALAIADILKGHMYDTVTSLHDMDFFNKVVQFDEDPNNVASSDSTFIFCGPPILNPPKGYGGKANTIQTVGENGTIKELGGIAKYLRPIGAVQQYGLQQGRQIVPFPELGSRLKRHANGSGMYNAQMARVLTRTMNLKASLYQWLYDFCLGEHGTTDLLLSLFPSSNDELGTGDARKKFFTNNHWIGMESEIFNIPFGLLCITGAADGRFIHMEYLERCYMPTHGIAYSAGNSMIVPNVSIMVTRPVPFIDSNGDHLIPTTLLLKQNRTKAYKLLSLYSSAA